MEVHVYDLTKIFFYDVFSFQLEQLQFCVLLSYVYMIPSSILVHALTLKTCSFWILSLRFLVPADKKAEGRSRVDRDADNLQLQQLEEKDVVSSVATVLSDLCGPGEWMPMEKLHTEVSSNHYLFYVSSFALFISRFCKLQKMENCLFHFSSWHQNFTLEIIFFTQ